MRTTKTGADRWRPIVMTALVAAAAFLIGRASDGWSLDQVAEAAPPKKPSIGFPVNAGEQRLVMIEELRAIREILDERLD